VIKESYYYYYLVTLAYVSRCVHVQILTQEDWNEVLYNGMSRTSAWAALYFIALMTFGNYVLFNLLVAILVEGFSSEVRYSCPGLPRLSFLQRSLVAVT